MFEWKLYRSPEILSQEWHCSENHMSWVQCFSREKRRGQRQGRHFGHKNLALNVFFQSQNVPTNEASWIIMTRKLYYNLLEVLATRPTKGLYEYEATYELAVSQVPWNPSCFEWWILVAWSVWPSIFAGQRKNEVPDSQVVSRKGVSSFHVF